MKITKLKISIFTIIFFYPVFSFAYYIALSVPINFDGHTNIEINELVKERNSLLYGAPITNTTALEFTAQYKQRETEIDEAHLGGGITKYYRYRYLLGSNIIYQIPNKLEESKYIFYMGVGYSLVGILENTKNEKSARPNIDASSNITFATTQLIFGCSVQIFHNSFLDLRAEFPVFKVLYADDRENKDIDFLSEFSKNYTIPIKFMYRYVF